MATPPTELPPFPSQPGQPDSAPPEVAPTAPDVDVPSPGTMPSNDPGFEPGSPVAGPEFA